MFRGLRLRLSLLYMLASALLIGLIGGATYQLTDKYFQSTTDAALQHKLASELRLRGIPLPREIAASEQNWYTSRGSSTNTPQPTATAVRTNSEGEKEGEKEDDRKQSSGDGDTRENETADEQHVEEILDGDLASVFVIPVSVDGEQIVAQGTGAAALLPVVNQDALSAALSHDWDWRTVLMGSGTRMRLLTYKLPGTGATDGAAALQVGRPLGDQDRVLNQLLLGLLGLSAVSVLLLGASSWWLAGRSLRPAQQAWERQQTFVANASHELRAPLTLMRASTEVALRTLPTASKENRELLKDVLQECDHMDLLVADLLLLSRLDSGGLALEQRAIPVQGLFVDVSRQVGRVAQERGIALAIGRSEGSILADPTRLRQVFLILLDNALRYTPPGGTIHMDAQRKGTHIQISIADTGTGISPEHLPHLFERFYRAAEKRGGKGEGSGLGLSIAKGLIEAQRGHIWIESNLGQGTRVTLSLPAAS